ncbi:MAG: thioredoxin family protein [Armatimonadota bacterium]
MMRQVRVLIGAAVVVGLVLALALPVAAQDNPITAAHAAIKAALDQKDFNAVWAQSHTIVELVAKRDAATLTGPELYALGVAHYYLVAEDLNLALKVGGLAEDQVPKATAMRDRIMGAEPQAPLAVTVPVTPPAVGLPDAVPGQVRTISKGQQVTLTDYVAPGKPTVFDFFSEFCPPCRALSPKLEKLAQTRPDLSIVKVDINRPGIQGIDWQSPVARQYKLQGIPHLKVFGADGKLQAEGDQAWEIVNKWLAGGQ